MPDGINLYDMQQGLSFLIGQLTYIEPTVYAMQYPDVQYQDLVPIDNAADEWTKTVTYFSSDMVGRAEWFHAYGKDIPYADVERTKFETNVLMAGIGYEYNLEEINQARRLGIPLTNDKASAAKRAAEEFVDKIALRGDPATNFEGLINHSAPAAALVPNDGTAGSREFDDKTSTQVIRDLNTPLAAIWTSSNTIETADTVLLPLDTWMYLATTPLNADHEMTILQWFMANNAYTAQTGQPLRMRAVRGLETAGAGGTRRMIHYRRDPGVLKMHIPMPHRFLSPQQIILIFKVPGIMRLGGLDIRRPGAVRYSDGI